MQEGDWEKPEGKRTLCFSAQAVGRRVDKRSPCKSTPLGGEGCVFVFCRMSPAYVKNVLPGSGTKSHCDSISRIGINLNSQGLFFAKRRKEKAKQENKIPTNLNGTVLEMIFFFFSFLLFVFYSGWDFCFCFCLYICRIKKYNF